ncbi:MAG: N-acyl homoserine lactonase family protein [Syntrophales bacterium]|jgi:glyoxylase-like metal-dependent hydrolase (beta-lactamase superfamily II)|nr:N-acyl homoserine lactonase family protein [Syntrophales bacterium]
MKKKTLKIHPLDLGTLIDMEKSVFTIRQNQGVKVKAPCLAWAVLGGEQNILVDSGPCSPEAAVKYFKRPLAKGPNQELAAALKKIGLRPQDIDIVIFTHLHWDHCFNLEQLTKAAFLVQKKELLYAVNPLPPDRVAYQVGIAGIQPAWMSVFDRIQTVEGDAEVVPGVRVVPLPGHTPGSQGVIVETAKGPWAIVGDTVPLYENWDKDRANKRIAGGIYQNLYDYFDTLNKLGIYGDCILPGHEEKVLEKKVYPK